MKNKPIKIDYWTREKGIPKIQRQKKLKDKYYTVKETAKLLKISERTVWRWIESGKINPIKVNRVVRIGAGEIKKLTIGGK